MNPDFKHFVLLNNLSNKLNLSQKENDYLREEYQSTIERYTKLTGDIKRKELEWKHKFDELSNEYTIKNTETMDAIKNLNKENEYLKSFYKVC
jgi:hypothetical protein